MNSICLENDVTESLELNISDFSKNVFTFFDMKLAIHTFSPRIPILRHWNLSFQPILHWICPKVYLGTLLNFFPVMTVCVPRIFHNVFLLWEGGAWSIFVPLFLMSCLWICRTKMTSGEFLKLFIIFKVCFF